VANVIYPLWKQALMREFEENKSLDQTGDNGSYVTLVTTTSGGYVYSDTHQYYSDITGIQGSASEITNPQVVTNVFSGDVVVFVNVTGTVINALVVHRQNGAANTTWRLVLYEDTGILGFPLTINGGNVILKWNVQGIFGL
jgi:hypothetical protein